MPGILTLTHMVEARYRNQEHGVAFECPLGVKATEIARRMHAAHKMAFTFDLPDAAVELTSVHLQAEAPVETFPLSRLETAPTRPIVPDRRRRILLSSANAWIDCEVYRREALAANMTRHGPALIEEAPTTTLVLPGQSFETHPTGQLIIREAA